MVAVAAASVGDPGVGVRVLRPPTTNRPAANTFGVLPYTALQQMFDAADVYGRPM